MLSVILNVISAVLAAWLIGLVLSGGNSSYFDKTAKPVVILVAIALVLVIL